LNQRFKGSQKVAEPPFIGHWRFAGDEAERPRSQGHGATALLDGRERTERSRRIVGSPGARRDGRREPRRLDGDPMAVDMLQTRRRRGARFH
jgi:hypothetical protein